MRTITIALATLTLCATIDLGYGADTNSTTPAAPPANAATPIPSAATLQAAIPAPLSSQTKAILDQTQNLTADVKAALDTQLGDLCKGIVLDAQAGKADPIKHAITQQYLSAGTAALKAFDPDTSIDQAVLDDFNFYTIVAIDKVTVDKGVAIVEARIAYLPTSLADILDEEKERKGATEEQGAMWDSAGGHAMANVCEKNGLGRVTYYLVVQNGFWRLHYSYFSLNPIPPSQIAIITRSMSTLLQ